MVDEKFKQKMPHSMILENRNLLSLTGVTDVASFDEQTVIIYTDFGQLNIKGNNLHINRLNLDDGEVSIDGSVSMLVYTENSNPKSGMFSKLFK